MFKGWITRKEEAELPTFTDYKAAFDYFMDKYPNSFELESVEEIGGKKCYFCALIVDRETYFIGRRKLMQLNAVTGMEFPQSYQPIQIMQDGSVHIVH